MHLLNNMKGVSFGKLDQNIDPMLHCINYSQLHWQTCENENVIKAILILATKQTWQESPLKNDNLH